MEVEYLTIRQAAQFLGVTPLTLRNWDKSGKLVAQRHPMSNYRLYRTADIMQLLDGIRKGTAPIKAKKSNLRKRKLVVRSVKD